MKKIIINCLLLSVILVAGCSSHKMTRSSKLKPKEIERNKHYIVSTDASIRASIVSIDDKGNITYLSEVSPDAMVTAVTNLTSKLTGKLPNSVEVDASQIVQITQSVTELGKRTVAVSILRDALYRLEEYNMNDKVRSELKDTLSSTYKLFLKTLQVAETIAMAELKAEQVKETEEQTKKIEAEIESQKLKIEESKIKSSNTHTKYETATQLEIEGFEYLLKDDIDNAIQSFKDAETVYPSFHNTYEIGRLLKAKKDDYNTKNTKIEVLEKIIKEYSWGMPPSVLKELTSKVQTLKK